MEVDSPDPYMNLMAAIDAQDLNAVRRWMALVKPNEHGSEALQRAAEMGDEAMVHLLLPISDPKARDSGGLRMASEGGHLAIVRLLLPLSDPKDRQSEALLLAAQYGHQEVVDLLVPHSDLQKVWDYVVKGGYITATDALSEHITLARLEPLLADVPAGTFPKMEARVLSERLHQTLNHTLAGGLDSKPPKARL